MYQGWPALTCEGQPDKKLGALALQVDHLGLACLYLVELVDQERPLCVLGPGLYPASPGALAAREFWRALAQLAALPSLIVGNPFLQGVSVPSGAVISCSRCSRWPF